MERKAILKTASEKDSDTNIYEVVTVLGVSELSTNKVKFRIRKEDGTEEKVIPSRVTFFTRYIDEIRETKNHLLDLFYAGVDVEEAFTALCELEEELKL